MASVWGTGSTLSFEERCRILARIGFKGVDLPTADQVPILKKYGLAPAMMTGAGTTFQDGLIRKELHPKFEAAFRAGIDTCAEVGCPNLIAMPGERRGMPRDETVANTVAILNRVKGYAEQKNVTLCMEITNSKVVADQRTDQVFNHLDWGLDVCRAVNSPRVKIVYDIYHVQIMDGDLIRRIRDHQEFIGHVHTAGNPGRGDLDDKQEIQYKPIMETLLEIGYAGYVGQEFIPQGDPFESLSHAVTLCDV
jgi:hydroxypyruvate isomerase